MLSDSAQTELLHIAHTALEHAVRGEHYAPDPPSNTELEAKNGCFVTLKTNGRLRGCIGCFSSETPLYRTVAEFAFKSAREDPRFTADRIRPDELDSVHLDISVLSPMEPCDSPESIELGKHGIYVKSSFRSGCFLPQVATETGWSVDEFWSNCCSHKAGLPADAWRTGDAETYIFTAEVLEDDAETPAD